MNPRRISYYTNSLNNYLFYILIVLVPLIIGIMISKLNLHTSVEITISLTIIFIAFILAYVKSGKLVVYIISCWAFVPEIRRINDWLSGEYQAISMLSILPLAVTCLLLLQIFERNIKLNMVQKKILTSFMLGIIYALIIGVIKNKTAALYEFSNYTVPFFIVLYVLSLSDKELKNKDYWLNQLSNIAVIVAIYSWIQYLVLPPWDAFWMQHVEMNSIGKPEPLKVRVFSTLNSPGPASLFLAMALVPMLFNKKWRGLFGWLSVVIVTSALAITLVRSSWLFVLVAVIAGLIVAKNKMKFNLIGTCIIFIVCIYIAFPLLPSNDAVNERVQSFSNIQQDNSFNARLKFTQNMFKTVISNPIGNGLGSTGTGTKLNNDGSLGENGNFDNGVLNILYTFGLVGSIFIVKGFFHLFNLLFIRIRDKSVDSQSFVVGFTMLFAMVMSLLSFNSFPGLGGFLLWLVVSFSIKEILRD